MKLKQMKSGRALSDVKGGNLGYVPSYVEEIADVCFVEGFETRERFSQLFTCQLTFLKNTNSSFFFFFKNPLFKATNQISYRVQVHEEY